MNTIIVVRPAVDCARSLARSPDREIPGRETPTRIGAALISASHPRCINIASTSTSVLTCRRDTRNILTAAHVRTRARASRSSAGFCQPEIDNYSAEEIAPARDARPGVTDFLFVHLFRNGWTPWAWGAPASSGRWILPERVAVFPSFRVADFLIFKLPRAQHCEVPTVLNF